MKVKDQIIFQPNDEIDKYYQIQHHLINQICAMTLLPIEAFIGKIYKYYWGNNEKRLTMKGRFCRVLARGKMNSCLIQFIDDGQREVVSRNALRKIKI